MQEIYRRELENWQGSDDEGGDYSQTEGEDSDDDDEDEGGVQLDTSLNPMESIRQHVPEAPTQVDQDLTEAVMVDTRPLPRPFETLRDFFSRTSTAWQDIVLEKLRKDGAMDRSVKELRKIAFDMSEIKWWDSREEITALEDEQEEAGIGEVVNIADRNSQTGGVGRRR